MKLAASVSFKRLPVLTAHCHLPTAYWLMKPLLCAVWSKLYW